MLVTDPFPAWHNDAQCSGTDTPQAWDTVYDKKARGVLAGFEACYGCPVIRQCARYALDEHPIGVVCAGLALPDYRWWVDNRGGFLHAMQDVEATGDAAQAIATHLSKAPQYARAVPALIARGALPEEVGTRG